MRVYFKNKEELVQYVDALLPRLKRNSASTMTIIPGQFEDFSVSLVTVLSSEDTAETKELNSFSQRMNTLHKSTQGG